MNVDLVRSCSFTLLHSLCSFFICVLSAVYVYASLRTVCIVYMLFDSSFYCFLFASNERNFTSFVIISILNQECTNVRNREQKKMFFCRVFSVRCAQLHIVYVYCLRYISILYIRIAFLRYFSFIFLCFLHFSFLCCVYAVLFPFYFDTFVFSYYGFFVYKLVTFCIK